MSALVMIMFLVAGPGLDVTAVFMMPLIRSFHWTHAEVARIAFATAITGGLVAPVVGWLIDRVGARWVMAAGLAITGAGYWLASYSGAIGSMVASFAVCGVGAMLSGLLPVMVVAVNWFGRRRGFAGGVVFIALGLGMAVPPPILTWLIAHYGWRIAIRWVSVPPLLIVLPMVLAVMRTRPQVGGAKTTAQEVAALPGLDFWPALCTAAFWLVLAAEVLWNTSFLSVIVHSITYMIGLGMTPEHAALIYSSQTLMSAVGAVPLGMMADRFGVRPVLASALASVVIGVIAFCGFSHSHLAPYLIPVYILCWGFPAGCTFPLLPVLLSESLGLRRFGSLSGIVRFAAAISGAFGPVISGHIFDVTGNYVPAFELAIAGMLLALLMVVLVRPVAGRDAVPETATVLAAGRQATPA